MPKAALLNSADSSQKTIMARKNALTKGMFVAKLKNKIATNNLQVKPISRALFTNSNNDNKENEAPTPDQKMKPPGQNVQGLSSRSKKIGKLAENPVTQQRNALADLTNTAKPQPDIDSSKKPVVMMQKKPTFLEDRVPFTQNYIKLNYMNKHSRRVFSFYCFQDKELKFPNAFAEKTIAHSCDNDCTTDEDQIRGAKRNLQKALETYIKEQKDAEMNAKNNNN
jgi:hypothetical protein